ncbi:MAG TPA: hypothetical protein VMU03_00415 [Gammaproteobacteria bacterium]|nr:hypothetical protein [Gammaproteobacteria bacterium]
MSGSHKWIRPLKENRTGKVVPDSAGSRWEWDSGQSDETSRLLRKLHNDELAIERTDITPNPLREGPPRTRQASAAETRAKKPLKKTGGRDAAGGFDPYDHTGKPRKR